jgi:hypothetical protein
MNFHKPFVTTPFVCKTYQRQKAINYLLVITWCGFYIIFTYFAKKTIVRATIKEIRKAKWKEKEEKKTNKVTNNLIMNEQATKCVVEMHARDVIATTWSTSMLKKMEIISSKVFKQGTWHKN